MSSAEFLPSMLLSIKTATQTHHNYPLYLDTLTPFWTDPKKLNKSIS